MTSKGKSMKKAVEAVYMTVKNLTKQYTERSVSAYSAQAAFFIFVSFFPFVIILFYVINLFPDFKVDISADALELVPQYVMGLVEEARNQATVSGQRTVILLVSVATALWSASKGIYGITMGLDSVYKVDEKRSSLLIRLRSTLYTLAFIVILIAVLGLLVFGGVLHDKLLDVFPDFAGLLFIIKSFRFAFLLLVLLVFFTLTYRFLPNTKMRFADVFPGAVIASIGWLVFSYIYSLYIDHYNISSSVYGSLAAVVLLLLWLYSCMNILLSGALVNSWLSEGRIRTSDS